MPLAIPIPSVGNSEPKQKTLDIHPTGVGKHGFLVLLVCLLVLITASTEG